MAPITLRTSLFSGALVASFLLATAARGVESASAPPPDPGVRGRVSATSASPLARASVFAFEVAHATVIKVVTGQDGAFHFDRLPAGVYKLIAFKPGFEPGVVLLSRAAAEALQFVELRLAAERRDEAHRGDDFWAVRDEIPADVLRDLEGIRLADLALSPSATNGPTAQDLHAFHTAVRAMTGVEDVGGGSAAQLAGGGIGMEGRIGSLRLGVTGDFWHLAGNPEGAVGAGPQGQAANLAVSMTGSGEGQFDVTTISHRLLAEDELRNDDTSADFERYRVSWSQPFGERSRSRFSAQYTSQSNFLRPAAMGSESRALNLEGTYHVELSDRSSLETGLRYRERDGGFRSLAARPGAGFDDQQRALELFGKGGWQLQPSVLVEYGLYTQLRDGSLALAPQGGMVVQLGDRWQAMASASQRLDRGQTAPLDAFTPVRFANVGQDPAGHACQDLEQHCYRVLLSRQGDDDSTLFAVGAVHRELAEALHLYFDDDILNHLESLYLVQGDQLPEVQVVVERRVAPRVLARLESSYAKGGGGILYAVDDKPYQNRVSYLVTSLDTRFQRSSTGVFLAFHHLAQGVEPLAVGAAAPPPMELERLQLMLSQDLNVLMRLAADWAVHLNFEVSRGALPFALQNASNDEVRRRVTGGLSVKF
ncbi:MAG TPA: carboxypeptidase regulatory-like domain-containing protein [Thermoanaerobaculia bacterium]|jgi:hypothetical protein|nr:carboxypeptidase regulatory-like domain-containing protein [Thermoanaerobaculia bacterium]